MTRNCSLGRSETSRSRSEIAFNCACTFGERYSPPKLATSRRCSRSNAEPGSSLGPVPGNWTRRGSIGGTEIGSVMQAESPSARLIITPETRIDCFLSLPPTLALPRLCRSSTPKIIPDGLVDRENLVDAFDAQRPETRIVDHKAQKDPLALPRKRVALRMPIGFHLSLGQKHRRRTMQ